MRDFICIECPKGCSLHVDDNNVVTGNTCPRGAKYALAEVTNPTRMLTSTVRIESQLAVRLPVITSDPIPKGKMFEVMEALNSVSVKAPIKCKDVVVKNICGLGVDILASRTLEK